MDRSWRLHAKHRYLCDVYSYVLSSWFPLFALLCFSVLFLCSCVTGLIFQDVRRQLEDGSASASSLQPLSVVSTSSCCLDVNTCEVVAMKYLRSTKDSAEMAFSMER